MLAHLSSTSPYVCDLTLGPIEPANRMASAPTKKTAALLEHKESFPRIRTPLKLLAPDEVPVDTTVGGDTTTVSRQPSLQPVWYTEQTIVDDNNEHPMTTTATYEQDVASIIQQQQERTPITKRVASPMRSTRRTEMVRATLPTIESASQPMDEEPGFVEAQEELEEEQKQQQQSNQPSLMRKSSTFTIEQHSQPPLVTIDSPLNESEKENDSNVIITSSQEEVMDSPKNTLRHLSQPSDDSFRALEHLLGLGSMGTNLTINTAQESPKSNHDTLSLTIVTPTELINSTTTSLHLSYAPAGGSVPSSNNILLMPTIESITDPSMNSTIPPPFLVDNSDVEDDEPSSTGGTVVVQQSHNENESLTGRSLDFTDDEDEPPPEQPTPTKEQQSTVSQVDEMNNDEENNFSFELNDFPNNSKVEELPSELTVPPEIVPPPIVTIRAPTCADVAYRALIKPRVASGRISQPVKTESPLAKSSKIKINLRSSMPVSAGRVLRSSCRRVSTETNSIAGQEATQHDNNPSNSVCFVNNNTNDDLPRIELVEMVTLPEEDEQQDSNPIATSLLLTSFKEVNISPTSAEEADCSGSSSSFLSTTTEQTPATPLPSQNEPLMSVLSREYTFNTPTATTTRISTRNSVPVTVRSAVSLPPIQPMIDEEEKTSPSENVSMCSITSSTKTMLSMLSTCEAPPIVLQKSLNGSASPSPVPTPTAAGSSTRKSARFSSNITPRASINPLHSSTPSRHVPLQMVSIGEKEQVSTVVPQPLSIDDDEQDNSQEASSEMSTEEQQQQQEISNDSTELIDNQQQVDVVPIDVHRMTDGGVQTSPEPPIRIVSAVSMAVQTTPSLAASSRRRLHTAEQQTTPIITRSSSNGSQTTPVPIAVKRSSTQQTSPLVTETIALPISQTPNTAATISTLTLQRKEYEHQITPLHSKAVFHLRRNVRFQFTPSTDARLTAKERQEDEQNQLRSKETTNKPIISDNEREEDGDDEIEEPPAPIREKAPAVKKSKKTKTKKSTATKKTTPQPAKSDESSEDANESPVEKKSRPAPVAVITRRTRRTAAKDTTDDEQKMVSPPPVVKKIAKKAPEPTPVIQLSDDTEVTSTQPAAKSKKVPKRHARTGKKATVTPPPPPPPSVEKEIAAVVSTSPSPPPPVKRADRKRPNPKISAVEPVVTSSPTEPVSKRAKTSKQSTVVRVPSPSPDPPISRTRSKSKNVKHESALRSASSSMESSERQPITETMASKKATKKISSPVVPPVETPAVPATNNVSGKRKKTTTSTIKKGKRRLHSVEHDEGLNTADDEEEKIETTILPSIDVDLNQEEREKIEALTVVELKNRLTTTHNENLPKGARKAELVALLIKIETNLLKERKEAEAKVAAVIAVPSSKRTRRKK